MAEARQATMKPEIPNNIKVAQGTLKARDRRMEKQDNYATELIEVQRLNDDGECPPGCKWRVPRKKLSIRFVQDLVSKSSLPCKIDFIKDSAGVDIIWPADMREQCRPKPFCYVIMPRKEALPEDADDDPHYEGTLLIVLYDVPMATEDEEHTVSTDDLEAWLTYALQEEDRGIQRAVERVEAVELECKKLAKRIERVPYQDLRDAKGKPIKGTASENAERATVLSGYTEEKARKEEELIRAKTKVQHEYERRAHTKVEVELVELETESKTGTWSVRVRGTESEKLTEQLANKVDYGGIKLALKHENEDGESMPPWVGRGGVPDGSKPYIPNYEPYTINMRGVRVTRKQHGRGIYKILNSRKVDFTGEEFSFYHGEWRHGKYHGYGIHYTDEGIYSGMFENGYRRGNARFDYADGETLTGAMGCNYLHSHSLLNPQQYADGMPNGHATCTFADGSTYTGEFHDNRIKGRGKYISAMGEVWEGNFHDGVLHGPEGVFVGCDGAEMRGTWFHGQLDGEGETRNKRGDSYKGTFKRGNKFGKGFERYANGNQSIGWYIDNCRSGRSKMQFGKVKETVDPKTGKLEVSSQCSFEGQWRAGMIRSRGAINYIQSRNSYNSINRKCPMFPFLSKLKGREERYNRRRTKENEKRMLVELMYRKDIARRKRKMFRQQRHWTKKSMKRDHEEGVRWREVRAQHALRLARLDRAAESATEAHPGELITSLELDHDLADRLQLVEDRAEDDGERPFVTPLAASIRSDFEELEERLQLIDHETIMKKATDRAITEEALRNRK